jgi:alanyl-tRNA synthetase
MTDRLYYTDPYSRAFDATVLSLDVSGGRGRVQLDRTCFYPTSGGQPYDVGTLGGVHVVDVVDESDGSISHVVDTADTLQIAARVHGVIDWGRRFDHMQQHTGQHLLSAAFDRLFGVRTVSFHLGIDRATIDLARETTPAEIAAAENEANRIVWEDRPVSIRFATAEEAARLPLRKEPHREGILRLIDIESFDLSACGGTHVARTGEVGVIAVASWERFKGGQRVEFLCGGRALGRFRSLRDATAAAVRLLSTSMAELPNAIERLQAETKDQRRALSALQTELVRYRAEELAAGGAPTARGRLVLRAVEADANGLKVMASAVVSRPGFIVVLVSPATPNMIVVARSQDVDMESNQILSDLTARFGGRGGGKSDLAQGGGLDAAPETILDAARHEILKGTEGTEKTG